MSDRDFHSRELIPGDASDSWEMADRVTDGEAVLVRPPTSYRHAFGNKPFRLGLVEFRILVFLASRPYHAFTRRQILDDLATHATPIDPAGLDGHVTILREQLGVLSDFVQTVPGVGWRYKA